MLRGDKLKHLARARDNQIVLDWLGSVTRANAKNTNPAGPADEGLLNISKRPTKNSSIKYTLHLTSVDPAGNMRGSG